MRQRNWPDYNRRLVQRGSLTFLIDSKILKSLKQKPRKKGLGRPVEFSDSLILLLFMIKTHYKLTYRMLEGFAKYILIHVCPWIKIPTYSLICKRVCGLEKVLPKLSSRRPNTVLLDASGLRVTGEGEWKVKVHGRGRPRKWIKVHIAVDPSSQEIVAEVITASHCADATMTKKLLDEAGKSVKTVIADGAYDKAKARKAIQAKQARELIPPPKNARYHDNGSDRDKALLEIWGLGGDKQARSLWGKLSGYSQRALVETSFSRFKRHYGDRMFSQSIERQMIENRLKWYLLNKMNQIYV